MKKLLAFLLVITLGSCNEESIYSKIDTDLRDNRWQKSDIKTHEFTIGQSATPYEIEVLFSHVYGYQFPEVPLIAEVTYPDGSLSSIPFTLSVKSGDGKELGDCSGDICDLTQKIPLEKPIVAGKYKLRLMNNFSAEFLPNVLGIGIRVEKLAD